MDSVISKQNSTSAPGAHESQGSVIFIEIQEVPPKSMGFPKSKFEWIL
jgi:hypothetical protein